jgi:hypothetical protein
MGATSCWKTWSWVDSGEWTEENLWNDRRKYISRILRARSSHRTHPSVSHDLAAVISDTYVNLYLVPLLAS